VYVPAPPSNCNARNLSNSVLSGSVSWRKGESYPLPKLRARSRPTQRVPRDVLNAWFLSLNEVTNLAETAERATELKPGAREPPPAEAARMDGSYSARSIQLEGHRVRHDPHPLQTLVRLLATQSQLAAADNRHCRFAAHSAAPLRSLAQAQY